VQGTLGRPTAGAHRPDLNKTPGRLAANAIATIAAIAVTYIGSR
jgi:hypothetical protein